MSQSHEGNLKPTNIRTAIANSPDADHYSFKQWTGDVDHITTGEVTNQQVVVTMPSHSLTLNATYNPYRVLTVNQGFIIPGSFTTINYGRLYNVYAGLDSKNIASAGWHFPTKAEFDTLISYVGGTSIGGSSLKEVGTTHWNSVNTDATNSTGFSGIGNGYRQTTSGNSQQIRVQGYILGNNAGVCYYILLNRDSGAISVNWGSGINTLGGAIRLIKDDSNDVGYYQGNDNKIYHTTKIGTQVWTSMNLAETKFRDQSIIPIYNTDGTFGVLTTAGMCSYNNNDSNI